MREQKNGREKEEFEAVLAAALREMVEVEPRAGFAVRLRAAAFEAERSAAKKLGRLWRGWAAGAVAAGMVAGVMVMERSAGRTSEEVSLPHEATAISESTYRAQALSEQPMRAQTAISGQVTLRRQLAAAGGGSRCSRSALSRTVALAEPKLETFPAVTQRGDVTHWMSEPDGEQMRTLREASATAVQTMAELQTAQAVPLEIATIVITPLSGIGKHEEGR